jgi:adhesin transport system outer membrane protein
MNHFRTLLAAALLASITLCAPGADPARAAQAAKAPDTKLVYYDLQGKETTPVGGPVYLKETVDLTIKHNPNLQAFHDYRAAAEYDRKRSFSGFLPSVDAAGGIGFEQWSDYVTRGKGAGAQNNRDFYRRSDASVTLTQTLWDGFAAWSRYRMADAALSSAEHRLFDNAEALTLDAILAHMDVCRQWRMIQLSVINVNNHRNILQSQRSRVEAGASTKADVSQTQARLARAESSLADAKLALAAAQFKYRTLTGQNPGRLVAPPAPDSIYASLEEALAETSSYNSKIKSKLADIETAQAQKDLDKSAFSPRIYLEAGYDYQYHTQSSTDNAWGSSAMLRGTWNLYNGHYDWYNVKGQNARINQATSELEALRDNLSEETSYTWIQWQTSRDQVDFFRQAVNYNTQTRDMYMQQFNVGSRSLLDVLDSENELYSSSMQLNTALMNELAAQYRLLTLGGKILPVFAVDKSALLLANTED